MKIIQKLFLIAVLSFGLQTATAQIYDYKASSYSVSERSGRGQWGDWGKFVNATVIITLDANKDRVVVNSQEIQLYNITNYREKVVTKNDETVQLDCVNNDGKPATILFVTRKNQDNRKQIYIIMKDVRFVYNVY